MEKDMIYDDVEKYVKKLEKIRPALLQIEFKIGYMRANRLIEQLIHYKVIEIKNSNGEHKVIKSGCESKITPYINKDYKCLTCGSETGESHPITSYCFHCNTDNWKLVNPDDF